MRILLDENMDRKLRHTFHDEHEVTTVRDHGWSGKKNGDLLREAEAEFDVLVTLDKNMQYQQNLPLYNLAVVLITAPSNRRRDILPAMPSVNEILTQVQAGALYVVVA
jgi:predicted nuclease of predicted toxin-antitoxin system